MKHTFNLSPHTVQAPMPVVKLLAQDQAYLAIRDTGDVQKSLCILDHNVHIGLKKLWDEEKDGPKYVVYARIEPLLPISFPIPFVVVCEDAELEEYEVFEQLEMLYNWALDTISSGTVTYDMYVHPSFEKL